MTHGTRVAKLRKAALSCLQDSLKNLYNIHTKLQCKTKPFKSNTELPTTVVATVTDVNRMMRERLSVIFRSEQCPHYRKLRELADRIVKADKGDFILEALKEVYLEIWDIIKEWDAQDCLFVGVIPQNKIEGHCECVYRPDTDSMCVEWDEQKFGKDRCSAASSILQAIREERRQPTPDEYILQHLAYQDLGEGKMLPHINKARCLGTPGFRPHCQTYMSLTDPGEGHVMGTTRFSEWMEGAIVHVEHLERPSHLPRDKIESYRVPSVLDFSRVRLHVGSEAPTTYFLGRALKDSGEFDKDFLKIVHITAAAATSAFHMGAAECKIAMEGLSTSQAVKYMRALRVQVQRSRKQLLSAAWNLNQVLLDDFETNDPRNIDSRMSIALKGVEITSVGGFDKVTCDGASDTYPSKCIMYQLSFEEALTIVHEAHLKGLVTYFSAGFKFNEIKHAVYAGADGIGIGGAQVLRYMDGETGMHGPYTEENIPRILAERDDAANSIRGQGARLLARLDTMYFEGSISRQVDLLRQKLFTALLNIDEEEICRLTSMLTHAENLPTESRMPFLHRAKRILQEENPMLKDFSTEEEWETFTCILKRHVEEEDEEALVEEYDSDPWLALRHRFRDSYCPSDSITCFVRMNSFDVAYKF